MAIVGALPVLLQNGTIADATQVMADFNSIKTDVNANAATNGANSNITSLSGLTTPLSVPQGGSGSATPGPFVFTGGYRNIARRNGGLEVWQRGAGGAASIAVGASVTTGQYTADGWYLATAANEASVVSQQAGIANGSQWAAKVLRNNGQTGTSEMQFGFPLDSDELYTALGQFVRLSFTAKAGANWSPASGTLTASVFAGTGTPVRQVVGYTGQTTVLNIAQNLTTSATRYQGSSAAIVPTTTRQLEVRFSWTPVGTAGADDSVYIDDVQLEIVPAATGYTASNFERLIFQEQLNLCKRHYQKSFPYGVAPVTNGGIIYGIAWVAISTIQPVNFFWNLPVPLRLATGGTGTVYNVSAANAQIRNTTDSQDWSSSTCVITSNDVVVVSGVVNAGMSINDLIVANATVDAGI